MVIKFAVVAFGVLSLLGAVGCTHPNYDVEVYPGEEGTYTIKRVPIATAPAAPQATTDPDLAEVEKMWPALSPGDRQTVKNLVHRLANQQ
ncbi:MAG TPA: hypothetical protein VMD30_10045 [Tepidisphaeraceae bacterium]|nr:hypothetical protein [Tepidisphaeraceae bacterium]